MHRVLILVCPSPRNSRALTRRLFGIRICTRSACINQVKLCSSYYRSQLLQIKIIVTSDIGQDGFLGYIRFILATKSDWHFSTMVERYLSLENLIYLISFVHWWLLTVILASDKDASEIVINLFALKEISDWCCLNKWTISTKDWVDAVSQVTRFGGVPDGLADNKIILKVFKLGIWV